MATASSLYEVLGLPMSATGHEIKAAYRKLARTCHPDVVSMNQKEMSAGEFIKIHAAYSTLSDPDKRENYDRDLYRNLRPFGSPSMRSATMAAASGYTSRKWETDQYSLVFVQPGLSNRNLTIVIVFRVLNLKEIFVAISSLMCCRVLLLAGDHFWIPDYGSLQRVSFVWKMLCFENNQSTT
ncbi:hypothetical protein SADUNF_Sadunf09G0107400 [Salix dunnii]|uniref:J domain-containing protein n=1 Tax=Salix dunnii TaxID=1413687 RepID=A0A835JWT4_9ROSI|nr:hypothetical protein SADUNF_Sadunf09G0107400 [Salix dunnii]